MPAWKHEVLCNKKKGVWTNAESESAKSNSEAREKLSEGQEVLKPSIISLYDRQEIIIYCPRTQ